jgi:hypothetical protein
MNEEYPQHLQLLAELTNTDPEDWEPSEGPESGMGTDSYYIHPSRNKEVWINEDQDYITISCDGETLFEGEIQEFMDENLPLEESY